MKVVILCGGMGTRLREETEYKPKPMVEIGGKPILWHIMKHYSHYGFKDFILALGYKGNIIRDYFLNYYSYNSDITVSLQDGGKITYQNTSVKDDWNVTLVETGSESMTGYRVKMAGRYINGENFMVTYGDAVSDVNLEGLLNFHISHGLTGTVTGVFPPSRFGDLETNGNYVTRFYEKVKDPDRQEPINGGYFVFKKEFLDLIPEDPSVDLERLPMKKLTEKSQLAIFRHKGFWQCMDTYRDNQLLEKMWKENPVWKIWGD
ncbi:MAG TPA: glucose-1-phosphate cytidylyltransferase [Bacteroidales bacterium]|nr:glucose-1-phosphate cytidylyltransferase [Bacteroidales bacterium]